MQKVIVWRGKRLNQRTIDMVKAAEKLTGLTFLLAQGSYNKGGTDASAGTHDGGGAVDVDAKNMTAGRRRTIRDALRQVGFAAWIRDPSQGDWHDHVHAVAVGDKDLAPSAERQVQGYLSGGKTGKGHNGLANNRADDGPRTWVGTTWEDYLKAHPTTIIPPKTGLTMSEYTDLQAQINLRASEGRQETRRQAIWVMRYGVQIADDLETAADVYDKAISAGKTPEEAEAAYQASISNITADLINRANQNG